MTEIKHVPARIVVGPHGYCVAEGYTEIAGVRFYHGMIVVAPQGWTTTFPHGTKLGGSQWLTR